MHLGQWDILAARNAERRFYRSKFGGAVQVEAEVNSELGQNRRYTLHIQAVGENAYDCILSRFFLADVLAEKSVCRELHHFCFSREEGVRLLSLIDHFSSPPLG